MTNSGMSFLWDFVVNIGIIFRIKTSHSRYVSCFGPRMKMFTKVFYWGEAEVKYHASMLMYKGTYYDMNNAIL